MLLILRRAVVPVLLVLGGIAAVIYGAKFHVLPVLEEHESEVTIEMPEPFSPMQPSFPGMAPPDGPPQFRKKTVKKITEEAIQLAEPAMIYDATIGGIALNEDHKLKRTYSGKPPALCPT
jgi:hypothetical protein